MKLYAFQPKGHGPRSFFVMAESEDEARQSVTEYIEKSDLDDYDSGGWPDSEHTLTVLERGEVVENDND